MLSNVNPDSLFDGVGDSSRESIFVGELVGVYGEVCAAVLSVVGNRLDAEDVIQDVCVTLWEKFDEYVPETNFRKWALAYAFNIARASARYQRRRRGVGLSDHSMMQISQLQAAGSELFELQREVLDGCLSKLQDKDYRLVMVCYGTEISITEYAQSSGTPVATLYTKLKRIRKQLIECVNRALGKL